MRTMNMIVVLSLPVIWSLFAGCAADVKYGGDNTQFGVGQQFVEGDGCTIASMPSSGCLDYSEIKMQTWDTCQQAGLQLVAISVKPVDGCDNATEGAVDYQCCPAPPPPPPPDYSDCTTGTIGDGTCQEHGDFKLTASDACNQAGLTLFDLTIDNAACGNGGMASITYHCCPPAPSPPPAICTSGTIGNGTCQGYGDLKMAAFETCNQAGLVLIDMVPEVGGCPDGTAISTTYACASSGPCP